MLMGGNSGGGGKPGRSGGGGPDMTTPASEMGLDKTISEIYKIRQAITTHSQEMNSDKFYEGTREQRKAMRAKTEALDKRHTELKSSITRGERGGREVLIKGKEKRDLGPFTGSWSAHYGPNPNK